MPFSISIDRARKFVHVVAEGPCGLRDMEDYLDRLAVEDAFGFTKLFDASTAEPVYSDKEMYSFAGRISAYTGLETGPLAIVAGTNRTVFAGKRFLNFSDFKRPAKIFSTEKKARTWLAALGGPS
jgi:hypothetical protein